MSRDEIALYTLATRLIPRRDLGGGLNNRPLHLVAGKLPDDMLFAPPIPPSAIILGAVVEESHTTVLFDTELRPREVFSLYLRELEETGWMVTRSRESGSGFSQSMHSHIAFRRRPDDPALAMNANMAAGALTQVRLDLDYAADGNEGRMQAVWQSGGRLGPRLVELLTPAGCTLIPLGSGANDTGTFEHAGLETSLGLAAIADHYDNQMREMGWVEREAGHGERLAWSTWTLDAPGRGTSWCLFIATQELDWHGRYLLYQHVRWGPANSTSR